MIDNERESAAHNVSGRSTRWRGGLALAVAAVAAAGLVGATAGSASAAPAGDCLWAGTGYAQGTAVTAGGRAFTCATDQLGAPRWVRGADARTPSTVANPGATGAPTGNFSAGAQQPGTEYTDYCVGTQLVGGSESVYEVVSDASGALRWKAAGPISQWVFTPGTGPVPTTRSASLCQPDQVLWPELNR
ncbi:hypothetical protein F3087_27375 [Nocardia colli]|uniref:Uncharacterized protein n=1 Tax=Nocardia colli TaxID=2545717 RepID=A0A5N0E7H0_9NOCA|nr:hypothetical protein [Nocardia colli]KAA8885378.1 hypothetical protein F3087_27375 [Nocardia colli]